MTKFLLSALLAMACMSLPAITPAAAVGLYGGDPIGSSPEAVEYALCLAARPSDKSLCDAQYKQRMLQGTLDLLPSLASPEELLGPSVASDPNLLFAPPGLSAEERRHKEIMNGLQGIEDALRKR
jgi:hypothetical protein